jgi:hypothetical protein
LEPALRCHSSSIDTVDHGGRTSQTRALPLEVHHVKGARPTTEPQHGPAVQRLPPRGDVPRQWDAERKSFVPNEILVLTLEGARIAEITGFLSNDPFERFGLPAAPDPQQ